MQPILSIVIVNWNSGEVLCRCLRSIYDTVRSSFEVIVVDNDSSDDSISMIRNHFPGVRLIESGANLGFSKGNNLGTGYCTGKYLMLTNPDTILCECAADTLVAFLEDRPDVGIAGPQVVGPDGMVSFYNKRRLPNLVQDFSLLFLIEKFTNVIRARLTGLPFFRDKVPPYYWRTEECEGLDGSSFIIRRALYEALGGFDETTPMYLDDIDLFYQCRKAGVKVYYVAEARVIHEGHHSTKKSQQHKMYDVLSLYSRLLYYKKNHGLGKGMLYRGLIMMSVPYLLLLDLISLPVFLPMKHTRDRMPVIKKHITYLRVALLGRGVAIKR
ncbi:MAG: glycosyltransferase family 2 protein [Candidatus Omnitrophica bacterium]|nr:glycosyltransferase family 2 protein [Candidatus Omnitrophota bacterium]